MLAFGPMTAIVPAAAGSSGSVPSFFRRHSDLRAASSASARASSFPVTRVVSAASPYGFSNSPARN